MESRVSKDSFIIKTPIAHRGLHGKDVPENSAQAFSLAIEAGYAIETDVRLTKDKQVIIFHDDLVERMCGISGKVIEMEYSELEKLRLNNSSQKIITFKEFLKLVNGKVSLLIEIKNDGAVGVLESLVIEQLKDYKGEFAVQSFNPFSLQYFKLHASKILRGQLSCYFKGEKLAYYKKFLLKRMLLNKKSEPDFISYAIENMPNRFVKKYKIPLLAWTIRSKENLNKAKSLNANVIFENTSIFNK